MATLQVEEQVDAEPLTPLQRGAIEGTLGDVDEGVGPGDITEHLGETGGLALQ